MVCTLWSVGSYIRRVQWTSHDDKRGGVILKREGLWVGIHATTEDRELILKLRSYVIFGGLKKEPIF